MINWQDYQQKHYGLTPNYLVMYVINHYNIKKAIDLGCGSGNETVFMIRKGINVLAIDQELNENFILNRLKKKEKQLVTLTKTTFDNMSLPVTDFIVACFSLDFCNQDCYKKAFEKIKSSLTKNGKLAITFFGEKQESTPFALKHTVLEIQEILAEFTIIKWKEKYYQNEKTNLWWHYYEVIAEKMSKA